MQAASAYWDAYYAHRGGRWPMPPSQFSVFVVGETAENVNTVVDIGCGDGRDSFFFLSSGYRVVSIDASAAAIEGCRASLAVRNEEWASRAHFAHVPIGHATADALKHLLPNDNPVLVYARFFLHAVDEETETDLFRALATIRNKVAVVALEFRTDRDRHQMKATPDHYRRFIRPTDVVERAALAGYQLDYCVEGFGMAKYRHEDAHVARILLSPKGSL